MLMLAVFIFLGCWQISRAKTKIELRENLQAKINNLPINLLDLKKEEKFLPVQARGSWQPEYFLLDNQVFNRKVGYKAMVPLLVGDKILLVDRGFVTRDKSKKLEFFGQEEVRGIIYQPSTGILLKADELESPVSWPLVIQSVDFRYLSVALGKPVYNFILRVEDDFLPQPAISFGVSEQKHFGYAVQWFSLAGLALYYLVRKRKEI